MNYALQKAILNELNERIPPGPKGDPQNHLRHIVNCQRLYGNSFDQSVQIGVDLVRNLYPNFTPEIRPARQGLDFSSPGYTIS
jgi:hypothetical protein